MSGAKNTSKEFRAYETMKEALLYEKTEGQAVICNLCAHRCFIPPGRIGICPFCQASIDGVWEKGAAEAVSDVLVLPGEDGAPPRFRGSYFG